MHTYKKDLEESMPKKEIKAFRASKGETRTKLKWTPKVKIYKDDHIA